MSLCTLATLATTSAVAQDGFRIETDIFVEGQEKPINRTLTLFYEQVAYDVSRDENRDITMVDPKNDRILRFSPAMQLKTEVKISELQKRFESAKTMAQSSALAVFVNGASQVQVNDRTIKVGATPLEYECTFLVPPDEPEATAKLFRKFADATKLLNSFTSGGTPPFARMALNAALEQEQAIPGEILMRTGENAPQTYRCVVNSTWRLSTDDRKRIEKIQTMLVTFTEVNEFEYQRRTTGQVATAAPLAPQPQNASR